MKKHTSSDCIHSVDAPRVNWLEQYSTYKQRAWEDVLSLLSAAEQLLPQVIRRVYTPRPWLGDFVYVSGINWCIRILPNHVSVHSAEGERTATLPELQQVADLLNARSDLDVEYAHTRDGRLYVYTNSTISHMIPDALFQAGRKAGENAAKTAGNLLEGRK